jgi:hypothetical protein
LIQEEFKDEYASMGTRQWYHVVRDYMQRMTQRPHLQDEEIVTWQMAAEPLGGGIDKPNI